MEKRKTATVLGVIFGLYLIAFAFCCFVLGIVIAIAKNIDFTFTMFVFPVLGIATIISAFLSKKAIITTQIIYLISTIAYIAMLIFFAVIGLYKEVSIIVVVFFIFAILAIVATIFAFLSKNTLSKNESNEINNQ